MDAPEWQPQLVLVSMKGTCGTLKPKINEALILLGEPRAVQRLLQEKPLLCFDCAAPCKLDEDLARNVRQEIGE